MPSQSSQVNFDDYNEAYEQLVNDSISFAGRDHSFYIQRKADYLLCFCKRFFGQTLKLSCLDTGCGTGSMIPYLLPHFKNVVGVDVSKSSIEQARAKYPNGMFSPIVHSKIPSKDGVFDVTIAICVFHHVRPRDRRILMLEMKRVTSLGGVIMIFEHNPFNPLTRLAVSRCAFDRDAQLLTLNNTYELLKTCGLTIMEHKHILTLPLRSQIGRKLDNRLSTLCIGAQYYVAAQT